jgi:hypothetical protein
LHPASGNANAQGKGAYSIQATLQNIEDWSTQVSSSASKDANYQGQNSHAPFQGKEDLTPQLVQRLANPHEFRDCSEERDNAEDETVVQGDESEATDDTEDISVREARACATEDVAVLQDTIRR